MRLIIIKSNNKLKIKLKNKNGFLVAQTSVKKLNNNNQTNKQINKLKPSSTNRRKLKSR